MKRFLSIVCKPANAAGIVLLALMLIGSAAFAQTGGEGAIQGTVLDASGAVVPNASVTAVNVNTGVSTTRPATSAGFYSITPLIPGTYTVTVTAKGFQAFKQENLVIDAMHVSGLNVNLKTGEASETVTVTEAPPALETTNATLGGTIDSSVFAALPIMLQTGGPSNQQRDITSFSNLLPGAQTPPGGRSSIISGTGQRVGEVYVDGLPLTTATQQGDNRPVYNLIPFEAISQVQVVTSGFAAEYQGAGLENYSTKSGTNQYHGSAFGYFRNRIFDAWSFSSHPCPTCANKSETNPATGFSNKPLEHIYEIGFSVGGPISIPHLLNGHNRLFFYGSYDKYRQRLGANFVSANVPTTLMRTGDFRELIPTTAGGLGNTSGVNYPIYDPTTQAACTAHTGTPCRYQYGFGPGPGTTIIATGTPNVIPASQISRITQYMQSFLPAPTNATTGFIASNFLGGSPTGYDNWIYSGRVDYDISEKNRLSFLLTGGNRHAVPFTGSSALPYPYISTTTSTVAGHIATMEDSYAITPHLVNQFKYGFINFGGPPVGAPTYGTKYSAAAAGITGLPDGQASQDFPNTTFTGNTPPTAWVGNNPSITTVSETYEIVDNIQYVKGAHATNFGFQFQWLEINASAQDTSSYQLPITWNSQDTAQLAVTGGVPTGYGANGFSYASFLLGAVQTSSVTQQPFSVYGGRFHNFSPYFQDDWKVTPKLTLNLGMRWDYMPSYREVLDRMTFLNPDVTNPITGNAGSIQFAGTYGGAGVSCNCHNLVHTWYKNFGPRLGFAYSLNDKTVIRGGYSIVYTHAGGVGGASSGNGTGVLGFTSPVPFNDSPTTGPAFYLNNNPAFSSVSPSSGGGGTPTPNANFGGPGFNFPASAAVTAASQGIGTGYYVCSGQPASVNPTCNGSLTASSGNGSTANYADPYLGDRAPELEFWNLGIQREVTKNMTIMVNYAGSQAHFLTGTNLRGLQSGQINPGYLSTIGNTTLLKTATAANIAGVPGYAAPYPGYTSAAAVNGSATIAHGLTWMPQYAGTSDTFGDVANASYHALQITLNQRFSQGLTFTVNYTYSKTIDDTGTSRSGWDIPASATSDGRAWKADRIDRSRSVNDLPQLLTIFGVYQLPFGKGHIGGDHFAVRALASGWQLSGIYQYTSGLPLPIVGTAAGTAQSPGQGTYMPDYNPNFKGSPRINGKWGQGTTAANLGTIPYIQGYINSTTAGLGTTSNTGAAGNVACATSVGPFCNTPNNKIGNLTRVAPYQLRGQNVYRLTMSVSRTFPIYKSTNFVFRIDCQNVTNHTTFGNNFQNISGGFFNNNVNSSNFGTVGGASADARAFQLSGRINF